MFGPCSLIIQIPNTEFKSYVSIHAIEDLLNTSTVNAKNIEFRIKTKENEKS